MMIAGTMHAFRNLEYESLHPVTSIVNRPMILLADEPTGNLDSKTGEEIMSLIGQIHRPGSGAGSEAESGPGRTIVMVTHERALAERYARRMLFLADGKLTDDMVNGANA